MSTTYYTREGMTLAEAAERSGWKPWANADGAGFTDGTNYVHVRPYFWNGEAHLRVERFGRNDPEAFVEALDLVDEWDEDEELPWSLAMPSNRLVLEMVISSDDAAGQAELDLQGLGRVRVRFRGQGVSLTGSYLWDLDDPHVVETLTDAVAQGKVCW